jgi:hypothetical protein
MPLMTKNKVRCASNEFEHSVRSTRPADRITAQHKLLLAWAFAGLIPFFLQMRSYLKFASNHKITETLVTPQGLEMETANLSVLCPVDGMLLSGTWFNFQPTHYFHTPHGRLCHIVFPQYNVHGTFRIGNVQVEPYHTTPSYCNESLFYEQYFYHGSIGFYSFYEEQVGTFCRTDHTAYVVGDGLGTFDINGSWLAEDRGSDGYRYSIWYSVCGGLWLVYRALVLRRSYVSCKRYGRACSEMNESLAQKEAMVFVQENLRLAAHGATNYHRAAVLYFLIEGIMTDLFLLVANNGFLAKVQYVSLGYNLSALLVKVFEMIESTNCLSETWRVQVKRLLFNYETAFVGEVFTAALQQYCFTLLNRSELKETRPAALAVSYYAWSLVGHSVLVLSIVALVISVRALWALAYVWLSHQSWAIFTAPCCVDTTLRLRNKMILLGGYQWENDKLYYTPSALKAFGALRTEEEDGAEFLVLRKINWFKVLKDDLFVIGAISSHHVEPCSARPCTGIVSFCDRRLGGVLGDDGNHRPRIQVKKKLGPPPPNEL